MLPDKNDIEDKVALAAARELIATLDRLHRRLISLGNRITDLPKKFESTRVGVDTYEICAVDDYSLRYTIHPPI